MGKSLRSKVKRTFRSKKRESGVYAAVEASRLQRLNARLLQITTKEEGEVNPVKDQTGAVESVSTHGPRGSRREEWRRSKGMPARKAGRPKRRR